MRFANDNQNTDYSIFQIRKLQTISAVSVVGIFRIFNSWLLKTNKIAFAVDNPNTETADSVGSFRIWNRHLTDVFQKHNLGEDFFYAQI